MPTYQNTSGAKATITGPRNESFVVEPGDSIAVPFYTTDSNFTKTSDSPITNRATATTSVTLSSTAADHDLNAGTGMFIITQITGSVTVRPQLDTAVPILLNWTSDDPVVQFKLDDFPCEKLRVSGSGTVTILEYAY